MTLPGQGDGYFIKGMGDTPGKGEVLALPQMQKEWGGKCQRPGVATTHHLETSVLGVGGILEYLNTASSLKS